MGVFDTQFGVKAESSYGTAVVVDRFFETDGIPKVAGKFGRVQSAGMRAGQRVQRSDRHTPYRLGADGDIPMAVMSKGFAWWLRFMCGTTATTGPVDSLYTHTGTIGELLGDSFTAQINKPFHPAGTNQAFTYPGSKITKWTLNNSVEGNLLFTPSVDAQYEDTAIALASASYPTAMENLTWVGAVITLGGTQIDVTEIGIEVDLKMNTARRYLRASDLKKEPVTADLIDIGVAYKMDFESLSQRAYVAAQTAAGNVAQLVATWTAPTLAGVSSYPLVQVTIPALRMDEFDAEGGPEPLTQSLSGAGTYDGTNSPITVVVKNTDSTA